jgi:hypothetical protein
VVPADNKWFTRVVVAAAVIETLDSLDLAYPEVGEDKLKELAAAKRECRNVWSSPQIARIIAAMKAVVHDGKKPQEALRMAGLAG